MPTPVTAGNFAINAAWGAGAAISSVIGTQQRCQLTVTAGAGPSISPSLTFTYPDGPYPLEPGILAKLVGGTGVLAPIVYVPGMSSTAFVYASLPVAGKTYAFVIDTVGI